MKTTIKLLTFTLVLALLASCSSSLHVSSSKPNNGDGIYYYADGSSAEVVTSGPNTDKIPDMEVLEMKYKEFLANDSGKTSDTVLFKTFHENPYDRLLVDSYQEAYERRIAARSNPYYGMNNWFVRYSTDYWYASAFDSGFYNVFAVGDEVWVEPTWITNMFGWPYYRNPWLNRYNDPDFICFDLYLYFGLPYNNSFGYYRGSALYSRYLDGYEYGRRPGFGTVSTETASASIGQVKHNLSARQVTLGGGQISADNTLSTRRPGEVNSQINKTSISNRRGIQDPEKKESVSRTSRVVVEPTRDKDNSIVSPNRVNVSHSITDSKDVTRSTRTRVDRSYTTNYTRPNSGNKNEFNASKYTTPTRSNSKRDIGTSNISDSRTYSRPGRTKLPSVTSPVSTSGRGSSISNTSSSSSSTTRSTTRSSSGSSVSSGTRSSSSGARSSSSSTSSSSSRGKR